MGLAEDAKLVVDLSLRDTLTPGLKRAEGAVSSFTKSAGKVGQGVTQAASGLTRLGFIAGGAAATGLIAAAKAGIDFQDAFAGVRKTTEGTPAQLDELAHSLRGLATRIPIKATDLAAIAQEAGALGVPRQQVSQFTETIAKLSAATTGLSTEAAAEAFGKLGNVLHFSGPDYERVASSLVALGNAGASSEGDIIEVAKRFGAAGSQAKLSAAQVLGFASAIASVGVEPEAAGSSLSRLFNNITKYIGTGDAKIKAFAKTTGLSVKEFSNLFAKDASGAMQLFLKSLSGLDRFKASRVLKDAGITNIRDINAVLLLSQNYKELKRQVDLSTGAFKANTALSEAAGLRFDTIKSKLQLLRNQFTEAGIDIAEGFLPALGRLADKLATFLRDPKNVAALKDLGESIGKALDRIDFDAIVRSAQDFKSTVVPVLEKVLDLVNALPGPIKEAGAAMLIAFNSPILGSALKDVTGGLGKIATGLGGLLSQAGGKLGAAGGLISRVAAQPVYVVNFPPGFGTGPNLGDAAKAGGAGVSAAGVAGVAAAFAAIVGAPVYLSWLAKTFNPTNDPNNPAGRTFDPSLNAIQQFQQTGVGTASRTPNFGDPLHNPTGQPVPVVVRDGVTPRDMDKLVGGFAEAAGRDTDKLEGGISKTTQAVLAGLPGINGIRNALQKLSAAQQARDRDFAANLKALVHATSAQAGKIAAALTKDILRGAGNVANTRQGLRELQGARTAAAKRGDTQLVKLLDADIAKVTHRLAAREQIAAVLRKDDAIATAAAKTSASTKDVQHAINVLKSDQKSIGAKSHSAAAHIAGRVNSLQATLRAKKLAVSIVTNTVVHAEFSTRTFDAAARTSSRYGPAVPT